MIGKGNRPWTEAKGQWLVLEKSPKRRSKTILDLSRNRWMEDEHHKLALECYVQPSTSDQSLQKTDLVLCLRAKAGMAKVAGLDLSRQSREDGNLDQSPGQLEAGAGRLRSREA